MKLSELKAKFDALQRRVDLLVQGVAASEFARQVEDLQQRLRELEAWTKPRGGGSFEVDIDPWLGAGGAPAFMRDHAHILLAAATTLRNARQVGNAFAKRLGPVERGGRDDLAVPLAAPLQYTGEEIGKIQRVFKYLYSRRAYRKTTTGEVWVRSLDEGVLPDRVRTIAQLSKHNLGVLRRALAPLSDDERSLHAALRGLPFRLKHATTAASWANIFNARMIFSKDALADWNIVVPSNTLSADERYKQDVDFAFFRVAVGEGDWVTHYGEGADQVRVVFDWSQLLEDGWITLHHMIAPLGHGGARSELRTRGGDELLRVSEPVAPAGGHAQWIHWEWTHRIVATGVERKVHILDEVFHGPDILEGIVLSVLRDLRDLPPLQKEALQALVGRHDETYANWLIGSLFRIEAKLPSAFRFEPEEIVRSYGAGADPALRAATGHAGRPDASGRAVTTPATPAATR